MALFACAPTRQADTVPTEDRIANSVIDMQTTACKAQERPPLSTEDNAALCSCVAREMQRTMSTRELLALNEAKNAAGPSELAKTHVVMSNDQIRRMAATCINEIGTPHQP